MKEIKDLNEWEIYYDHGLKIQHRNMSILPKFPLKFVQKGKGPRIAKTILKKNNKLGIT